ncbi:uncharacterized protein LOC135218753 [Macrobrachium nipponense]|uniref:uncharacterized protein LOC135218753 n=1 Tax=Macrobrachium nipponense TaxID=159736 RepID=UPI0030C8A9DD
MKNSKAVGSDGIPAEAWKAPDEEGIDILWQLMKKRLWKNLRRHMTEYHVRKYGDVRERRVMEKYVRMIREIYRNVKTSVRSTVGRTENFQVGVGLNQGSALSPLLFVLDVLTEDVREEPPWCLLYVGKNWRESLKDGDMPWRVEV